MLIEIDLSDDAPLYAQIAAGVRGAIANGRLHAGERLPTGRDLAAALDVNLDTVQRAYRLLADDGLVVSRVGRGTRVVDDVEPGHVELRRQINELVRNASEMGVTREQLAAMVQLGTE